MIDESWPCKKGLLKEPVRIEGTNIEIIRPFDGSKLCIAGFDFDGTLSLERMANIDKHGWVDLMVCANTRALIKAVPKIGKIKALDWVISDLEESAGLPTYVQMQRLSKHIRELGGADLGPEHYKKIYVDALTEMVDSKHMDVFEGKYSPDELRVKGALTLLANLSRAGFKDKMYLASGTDIEPVKKSAAELSFIRYFADRILAAGSIKNHPEQCAKKFIINQLVDEQGLKPGELLWFGDDYPEILYTHNAGGVCIGVLTPYGSQFEKEGCFTLAKKRERLISAGAHILVPDYSCAARLVKTIREGYVLKGNN